MVKVSPDWYKKINILTNGIPKFWPKLVGKEIFKQSKYEMSAIKINVLILIHIETYHSLLEVE